MEIQEKRLKNLYLDVSGGGSERQRYSEERVLPRWFDIDEFTKISWLRKMKEIMCNGDYFVMYLLINLESVKGFKCGSNVGMFRIAGDSEGK